MLTFGVLGPLEVRRDGRAVHVNGPKLRALLATLLLRANSVVHKSVLVDRLWDEDPPPAGRKSLQMYVLRLRRMLGDGEGTVIETHPDGYLLRVPPDALDLTRFRMAVRAASDAEPDGERALLSEALRCWRGPVLPDVGSESLHREDVPPLAEELLRVRVRFYDVNLELGRHSEVIGELVRVTEEHPWHETFWAQLVEALHHNGRRADALRTYRTVRRRFADDLGVEPGARLRQAQLAALGADGGGAPAAVPAVAQLPGGVTRFVGRRSAIARLDELAFAAGVSDHNIVISGPPGVGKTTLAVHVAHRWRARFPDGQLYVNLQGFAADPPLAASAALIRFLGALGFRRDQMPAEVEEQAALLRSALTGRRMLLVLDNAADARQVRPLLPGQPGSVVLITSRHDLRGLVVDPGATGLVLEVLSGAESRAVLTDLVGAGRVEAESDALGRLADTCGGLPLALRIAGANLAADPGCSVADYVTELTAHDRVSALAIDGDERSAVRAAFDQSYLRLSSADRMLFRLLGVVPGQDIGVEAAAALAARGTSEIRRAFDRLAAAGLLQRTEPGRCGFHDLIREYAAGLARDDDGMDADDAMSRLVAYYLRRATAAARLAFPVAALRDEPVDPALTEPEAVRWLEQERYNLLAAITWAATRPSAQRSAWRMVEVLHGYLRACGHTREAIATFVAALRVAIAAGNDQARLSLLDLLGQILYNLSEWERAAEHHEQMLALARELGDPDAEGEALLGIGRHMIQLGRPEEALKYLRSSLVLVRGTANVELELRTLGAIGNATMYAGRPDEALASHEQALILAREFGDREHTHRCLNGRGIARWALGQLDESLADHDQVLAYCRRAGQRIGEIASLACLAEVHLDAGRLDLAGSLAREALALSTELAERRTQVNVIMVLAGVHHGRGEYSDALRSFQETLRRSREIGFGHGQCQSLLGVAAAHRELGDARTARASAGHALTLLRANRQLLLEADVLTELARDDIALGDTEAATSAAAVAVEVAARHGRRLAERRARAVLAELSESRD
ncbi:DNA-binding transcriptional activator of the SARP family [Lentzea albidocapillata subsp. violacea]|uniref:DNA-binding transcriptional activator of the SARP family n=1 Tax=Lentzea albidocapillata subsp. violacea TaxID=128104 RepID=A0A1G8RNI2_9PSEU|nr:BTAD domain-containing putative transcriptional regulator [Lentzea albidocapillata]SDJ17950.1 DNA-binding transcriptional activator of the SARP family [Lentzea albidocapillata subsp. violacea]